MSDQLGSDRVIGNLESVDRADPYSGEAGVDALSDSPSEREVDEILSGKVDQWYAFTTCQRMGCFADEHHRLTCQLAHGDKRRPRRGNRDEGQVHLAVGNCGQMPG